MKSPQSALILGAIALILSLVAIGLQFSPLHKRADDHMASANIREPQVEGARTVRAETPEMAPAGEAPGSIAERLLDEQARRIEGLERQLAQITRVMRASGLDAAAPILSGPPGSEPLLTALGEQYATRARFEESRQRLSERATQMRQRDLETYGQSDFQRLTELSQKARPKRGNETQAERAEREAALNSLMTNYPESWATSVAVAEQALDAAMNRNTQSAEMYYESLVSTSPYGEVVTDQGIDAIPTLQTYLARQYIQEGRTAEASAILDALSAQSDRLIMEPNEMGEPTTQSVGEIVNDLRQSLTPGP
ncbi:hypothetical protein [Allochromatium vinosum]|uniref:Uncharacterized protein n=1 Tax=Allochromatium vinosum (strain ATCC 17899 / DSM 180 / NBRC 103801 / NCIMB 10441 / D) TaxID=572477 RepID=D3RUN9_ALLVD|nr:hypothetical protein [Allochromatium vinosum]ADC62898.1 hypothetical protein Alvin_1974 [Allochromatium vinosum DSM 180]